MILIYNQQGKILQTVSISDAGIEENYDPSPNFKIPVTQRYNHNEYMVVNNEVVPLPSRSNDYSTFNFEQKEWVINLGEIEAFIRSQRNQKLADSDWTQGRDVPEALSQLWEPYRQALRDVPQQVGFPLSVEWPIAPA